MSPLRRRLMFGIPLAVVVVGGAGFYTILRRMQENAYDPHALPSPLIGKKLPVFALPGADGGQGFANTDLLSLPKPVLVNWFASWCVPCLQEAPMLAKLAKAGLEIWGIAYQDQPGDLANFIAANGNPYTRLAADASGLTAINWGVYGVPETYLVDRTGVVRWRYAGALTDDVVSGTLQPLLQQYA